MSLPRAHKIVVYCSLIVLSMCFVITSRFGEVRAATSAAYGDDIVVDSRVRTFVYTKNEVFPITLHMGFQTIIEFGEGENVRSYSFGKRYIWEISQLENAISINPLERNISTNMIIETNKRRYYIDLQSRDEGNDDSSVTYVVRFFYPDEAEDKIIPDDQAINEKLGHYIPLMKPYNFRYKILGNTSWRPISVFDDGSKTFMQFKDIMCNPKVLVSVNGKKYVVGSGVAGKFVIVNRVSDNFVLMCNNQTVEVKAIESNKMKSSQK